mmetsp:Transcript_36488/g.58836  ORF Transcript_36488/g.58836 Transcript_36488/m.58836 type:complete len:130 (+) Transcript_36488:151-540(+)
MQPGRGMDAKPLPVVLGDPNASYHGAEESPGSFDGARPPMTLAPDEVSDALPPGWVKLLSYSFVFILGWGTWGFLDNSVSLVCGEGWPALVVYGGAAFVGGLGLRLLSQRYRGYALLDEIQDCTESSAL